MIEAHILQPYRKGDDVATEAMEFGPNLNVRKGTIVGVKDADSKCYPYDAGAADGTEYARGVAQYDFSTDGAGRVRYAFDRVVSYETAPICVGGMFNTNELVGLDETAARHLGRLALGSLENGVLRMA